MLDPEAVLKVGMTALALRMVLILMRMTFLKILEGTGSRLCGLYEFGCSWGLSACLIAMISVIFHAQADFLNFTEIESKSFGVECMSHQLRDRQLCPIYTV